MNRIFHAIYHHRFVLEPLFRVVFQEANRGFKNGFSQSAKTRFGEGVLFVRDDIVCQIQCGVDGHQRLTV